MFLIVEVWVEGDIVEFFIIWWCFVFYYIYFLKWWGKKLIIIFKWFLVCGKKILGFIFIKCMFDGVYIDNLESMRLIKL